MAADVQDAPVTRHDMSLLGIAVALLFGVVVAQLSSFSLPWTMFTASIPAVFCIGYVLFYRPPVGKKTK